MMSKKGVVAEFGRSMIEMLGVLAIVGVLSVGGIAGFQKAMMKHKINEVTGELSLFTNEILQYSAHFRRMLKGIDNEYIEITSSLDFFIPQKWEQKGGYIYDSMKNRLIVAVRTTDKRHKFLSLSYRFNQRDDKAKINLCMELYDLLMPYADGIYGIGVWTQTSEAESTLWVYGNQYCSKGRVCLKDMTKNQMLERCGIYKSDDVNSSFAIYYPI